MKRIDYLMNYLGELTRLANSETGYACTREISECIGWIREELDSTRRDGVKGLPSYSVEELISELEKRRDVHVENAIGPVKWEIDSGVKATLVVAKEGNRE